MEHAPTAQAFAIIRRMATENSSFRSSDVAKRGIPRVYLTRMERSGDLVRVARGVYRRPQVEPTAYHSLVQVASRSPKAVICLLSALAFHQIGTQNPFEVWIALPTGARNPSLDVKTRVIHLSAGIYKAGIEKRKIENAQVNIYSVPKTVVDCFRFRNRIGIDVAIEALKDSLRSKKTTVAEIRRFAMAARMSRVMQPYLEAV